jgi:hypothetical protein
MVVGVPVGLTGRDSGTASSDSAPNRLVSAICVGVPVVGVDEVDDGFLK